MLLQEKKKKQQKQQQENASTRIQYTIYHQLLYNYSLQEPHKEASFYSFF